ncbi:leucine-rich repeat-containing protein 51-like [Watersipora subatra]|uniref:leucine-rich repeat-containing protein 51-like n=1 Tax=Watersipora subatra TaxID=2589382 RepID=UPI00355B1129
MQAAKPPASPRKNMGYSTELEAPLDYSFYGMTSVNEVQENDARLGVKGNPILPKKSSPSAKQKLSKSKCFKLNNNCLPQVSELKVVAEQLFEDCDNIAWIDLSFNELTKVDDILLHFPNLQILYLHGNQFTDMGEIEKLAKISSLKKLSLHGNPIENDKGYKYMVMAMLPQLDTLDFSRITKADRRTAATLQGMNKNNRKGKRKVKKED